MSQTRLRIETDKAGKVHVFTEDGKEIAGVRAIIWDYEDGEHAASIVFDPDAFDLYIFTDAQMIDPKLVPVSELPTMSISAEGRLPEAA